MVNDMKKDKTKNIIKCILFFIIFCVLMGVLSVVFYPKTSDPEGGLSNPNARGFYGEPRNSLDVVVMGNSNAYSAYSPMMMWKNYGIPTYVAAEGAQNIAETVNVLQEVLTCQKPKLVVLDVDLLWQGKTQVSRVEGNVKSLIYKYIPIMKYHDRWKTLALKDSFKKKSYTYRSSTRGQYLSRTVMAYTGEDKMVETKDIEPVPKSSRIFLKMFLDICKENNVEVMFVEMPTASSWNYKKHNGMTQYAIKYDEISYLDILNQDLKVMDSTATSLCKDNHIPLVVLGIPFLDLNTVKGKNKINWGTDTRDGGKHLNCYGARKVTREIGKYISKHYSFENKKKDSRYTDWNKQYKVYKKYMKNPATVITVDENGEQTQTTVEAEKINKQSAGKKDKKKNKKSSDKKTTTTTKNNK